MKKLVLLAFVACPVLGQVANDADGNFDSTTYVETNGTSATTSTVTTNNTNTNTSTSENTNYNVVSGGTTNTNINTSNNTSYNENINTSTSNSTNINTSTSTNYNENVNTTSIDSTNVNINVSDSSNYSFSESANYNENRSTSINSNVNQTTSDNTNTNNNVSTSTSTSDQNINQKIESPPPSAIAPSIGSSYSQDLCTTGVSGAIQTQIFGFSGGKSVTDTNCERIKLSKTLYDMGMRVAAVSLMCQDARVWTAMKMAGTPCPYQGMIGDAAGLAWEQNLADIPGINERDVEKGKVTESPNGPK